MSNETLPHVIADLRDRAKVGFKKYGHGVEASPDDMLQHAYHEALDLAMYLKTESAEWADFTFPPLNLWNMPLHSEIIKLISQYYYEHYRHLW